MQQTPEKPLLCKDAIDKSIDLLNQIDLETITIHEIQNILMPLFKGYEIEAPILDPGVLIYRGRKCNKPKHFSDLIYPKPECVKSYGRANNIGESMFYGSIGKIAPLAEINAQVGDTVVMSYWITKEKLLLNHIGFSSTVAQLLKSKRPLESIHKFVKNTNNFNDLNSFVYNFLASNFTTQVDDNHNINYKVSVAISNKLLGEPFNGILYPSIALYGNTENVVLYPHYVDKSMQLVSVEFIKINGIDNNRNYSVEILDTATDIDNDGIIQWSGRYLSWTTNKSISAEVENGEWMKRDTEGNLILPKCAGDIIGSNTPLKIEFKKQKDHHAFITKEYTLNSPTFEVKILVSLAFHLYTSNKYIVFYIPDCPNINPIIFSLIRDFKNFEGIDGENIIELRSKKTDNLEYSIKDAVLQNKIVIYSEQKAEEEKLKTYFPNMELIFYSN